jgi:bacterial/archaeal transporter family protein
LLSPARIRINRIFVVLVVLSNTFGNFALAQGMGLMPAFGSVSLVQYILLMATNWHLIVGVALLGAWMVAQLTMLTWADLSYVLPVTASGYILTAFLGKFFLHEHISAGRWLGVVLIAIGSMLASMTPIQTVPHGHHEEPKK